MNALPTARSMGKGRNYWQSKQIPESASLATLHHSFWRENSNFDLSREIATWKVFSSIFRESNMKNLLTFRNVQDWDIIHRFAVRGVLIKRKSQRYQFTFAKIEIILKQEHSSAFGEMPHHEWMPFIPGKSGPSFHIWSSSWPLGSRSKSLC